VILPTKRIRYDHCLIAVGLDVLGLIGEGTTISGLWKGLHDLWEKRNAEFRIAFRWFILAIDLLYILGVIEFDKGLIRKRSE